MDIYTKQLTQLWDTDVIVVGVRLGRRDGRHRRRPQRGTAPCWSSAMAFWAAPAPRCWIPSTAFTRPARSPTKSWAAFRTMSWRR